LRRHARQPYIAGVSGTNLLTGGGGPQQFVDHFVDRNASAP